MGRQDTLPTRLARWVLVAAFTLAGTTARAELVVVVNASSGLAQLSRDEVVNIYMGRYRLFPDGRLAKPLDAPVSAQERDLFYRKLLDKGPGEIRAYWTRLTFTGRTLPPQELASQSAIVSRLERDTLAIAYLDRKNVTPQMRVVLELP
jgi:hypothetical protein